MKKACRGRRQMTKPRRASQAAQGSWRTTTIDKFMEDDQKDKDARQSTKPRNPLG